MIFKQRWKFFRRAVAVASPPARSEWEGEAEAAGRRHERAAAVASASATP